MEFCLSIKILSYICYLGIRGIIIIGYRNLVIGVVVLLKMMKVRNRRERKEVLMIWGFVIRLYKLYIVWGKRNWYLVV